jgi:ankyrin repeat protein
MATLGLRLLISERLMKRILSIFIGIIGTSLLAATAFADPIHDYARKGDWRAVQMELDKGVDVNAKDVTDSRGWTPLHSEWMLGFTQGFRTHKETVELLIDNGADVNAKSNLGNTPLHRVAMQDVKEVSGGTQLKHIAELLIAKGAVLSARNKDGKTPLEVAYGETATYLQGVYATAATDNSQNNQTGNQPTAKAPDILILDAAEKGDIEAVKQHLTAGTDANAQDKRGRTPLHFAAKRGQKELVELLIANGADVNAKTDLGNTPLHRVAAQGTGLKHIAELLIAKGAVLSARNKDGKTPLEVAKGATATYLQGVYATAATDNSQNNQTGNQPTANRPTGRRPTANRPTGRKPTANRSTGRKPTANRPTGRKPTANRSTGRKPTANRSARTQSPILKVLDANKDGLLSSLELQKLISRQKGRPTPLYNTLDTNRDGKLSSLELFGKP